MLVNQSSPMQSNKTNNEKGPDEFLLVSPQPQFLPSQSKKFHLRQPLQVDSTLAQSLKKDPTVLQIHQISFNFSMSSGLSHQILSNLKRLYLSGNKIGNFGAKTVAKGFFNNLTVMGLVDNNIGDQGAKNLSSGNFHKLEQLFLNKNELTAEGAKYLSNTNFEKLTFLNLDSNLIGVQGTKQLLNGKLKNITLGLWNNRINEELEFQIQKFDIGDQTQNRISIYF